MFEHRVDFDLVDELCIFEYPERRMLDAGSGKVKYWKAGFHYMNERKTEVENAAEGTSKASARQSTSKKGCGAAK